MKLFQYWDTPTPPDEVRGWIDGFRTRNPEFEHTLFDEQSAAAFILQHYGQRHHDAFWRCKVPAMQADLIRLYAILTHGGVYVDADNQSLRPLSELVDRAPQALLFDFYGQLNNGFMMFREPGNVFLKACLDVAIANIEARRFKSEFTATGPAILNALQILLEPESRERIRATFDNPWAAPWRFDDLIEVVEREVEPTSAMLEAFKAITLITAGDATPWIGANAPAYKETDVHWLRWKGDIYRTPQEVAALTG